MFNLFSNWLLYHLVSCLHTQKQQISPLVGPDLPTFPVADQTLQKLVWTSWFLQYLTLYILQHPVQTYSHSNTWLSNLLSFLMARPGWILLVTTHRHAHTHIHTTGTRSSFPSCCHLRLMAPFDLWAPQQWPALRPPCTHVHTEWRAPHPG